MLVHQRVYQATIGCHGIQRPCTWLFLMGALEVQHLIQGRGAQKVRTRLADVSHICFSWEENKILGNGCKLLNLTRVMLIALISCFHPCKGKDMWIKLKRYRASNCLRPMWGRHWGNSVSMNVWLNKVFCFCHGLILNLLTKIRMAQKQELSAHKNAVLGKVVQYHLQRKNTGLTSWLWAFRAQALAGWQRGTQRLQRLLGSRPSRHVGPDST